MGLDFYSKKKYKAKKPHKCDLCRKQIEIGEQYFYESGKFDGNIFTNHICKSCKPLQDAFCEINRNDLSDGYDWDDVITDIHESICYDCQKEKDSEDCKCGYGYYEIPKCEKVQKLYVELAKTK